MSCGLKSFYVATIVTQYQMLFFCFCKHSNVRSVSGNVNSDACCLKLKLVWSGVRVCVLSAKLQTHTLFEQVKDCCEKCQNIHSTSCHLRAQKQYRQYFQSFFIYTRPSLNISVVISTPWSGIPALLMNVNIGRLLFSCVTLIPIRFNANLCCRISASKFPTPNGPDSDVWKV